jgi:hypothetical protein
MKFARFADLPNGAVARSASTGQHLHKLDGKRTWNPVTDEDGDAGFYGEPTADVDRHHAPWTLVWVAEDPVYAYLITGGY